MTVLLQVSDAHFGTELAPVADALARRVAAERPELLVWTGDLTQRARRAQFEAARRFIDGLPARSVTMPGNHDVPLYDVAQRLVAPYARYRRAFGHELEPEVRTDGLLLMMVKTTRRWRHKRGELSDAQVRRVAERAREAAASQLRVVATHQPLHVRDPRDREDRLDAPADTLRRWAEAGVDLVLSGHTHEPCCYPLEAAGRRVWIVGAGTALSSRMRGTPNSVNLVRHEAGADVASVERWDHDPASGDFQRTDVVAAGLDRP